MLSYIRVIGIQRHVPGGKPALMMSILRFSRKEFRSRDNRAVAVVTGAPGQFVELQSIVDYAVPGVRGEPRGRKSGAGLGIWNPRWPARAEGEKRFRSATRNP